MAPLMYNFLGDMDIEDPTALLDVMWKISLPLLTKASMDWHDAGSASG